VARDPERDLTGAADEAASVRVPADRATAEPRLVAEPMVEALPTVDPREAAEPLPVLVLGYGNTLRRDDGVGVLVADAVATDIRLARAIGEGRVTVATAYQLTPEVALDFAAASLVILIDADVAGLPGAIAVHELASGGGRSAATDVRAAPGSSSHHVAPAELLALARELSGLAPPAVGIGIGVVDLELGEGLSGAVERAVPRAVDAVVRRVLEHLGG
jgi:hydrogenase maturation protease